MDKQSKAEVIEKFAKKEGDTGSAEVQIGLLTQKINGLHSHFEKNKGDLHSRYGLVRMVNRRRRLLNYLKRKDEARYRTTLSALGLRR